MIELTRDGESKDGTHGTFELDGKLWHSLEQPNLNNKPFRSCVPQGEYELVPYSSIKYGPCYVMVNEDLNVYHSKNSPGRPDEGRYKCLFVHRGNYVRNFQGCTGAGEGFIPGLEDGEDMITNTRVSCETVNEAVKQEGSLKLLIKHEVD